jgi:TRAP-type uncharacterized transport system fused permease subunit
LTGSVVDAIETGVYALFGLYAFTSAVQGWHKTKLDFLSRVMMAICAVGLLWPAGREVHIAALLILLGLVWISGRRSRALAHAG